MRRLNARCCPIPLLIVAVGTATAADYYWRGVNTANLYTHLSSLGSPPFVLSPYTNANTESYEYAPGSYYYLWKTGSVPGGVPSAGHTAVFAWDTDQTTVWSYTANPVVLDGDFSPDHVKVYFNGASRPNTGTLAQIQVRKALTTQSLLLSGGQSSKGIGLDVVAVKNGYSLTLNGSRPIAFDGPQGNWCSLLVENGATLAFTGASQTFDSFRYDSYNTANDFPCLRGGGTVEFTNPAATILLAHPGLMSRANLELGQHILRIDTNATWQSAAGTGFIRLQMASNRIAFRSTSDGRLDNLAEVAFNLIHSGDNHTATLPGGTYQGLDFDGGPSSSARLMTVNLTDDVALTGGYVVRGNRTTTEAAESAYSLRIGYGNAAGGVLSLSGRTLTAARGVRFDKSSTYTSDASRNRLDASGSTLNIGGNLVYSDSGGLAYRRVGIHGNATTVVNLRGSFFSNARSLATANLYQATVNLIGGTVATPNTWEVSADKTHTVVTSTSAIGTLNVGTPTEAASIRLLNNNQNDGVTQADEVLLAGTLRIRPGSTLDCNGKGVKVATALSVDAAGTLDLNVAGELTAGQTITTFFGVGDQTVPWLASASRVVSSTVPVATFKPVVEGGNTYWQVASLGGGTLMLLR